MTVTNPMDARARAGQLQSLSSETFDLVIVGGGINGAGVAADAALRGLKVLLLEQRDLAYGTSSRSSKLIHGGLRYLEHYQFRLVFEGTNERAALRKIAPHLVRPLLFALPVYEGNRHPLWKIDVGLWMYDGLSLFKTESRHVTLRSQKRMLEREPLLKADGLTGGIIYYDCATDDARLTLENAIFAARLGSKVVTRAEVTGLEQADLRRPVRVRFRDQIDGGMHTVEAKGVINCTGAWTDRIRKMAGVEKSVLRPTKGVHIVVASERLAVRHAAALLAPTDGRVFFAIPWNGRTVIGTTDTDDNSDPADLKVTGEDVDYLLAAANASFPTAKLVRDDVISTWAGLRPLIQDEDAEDASAVPREHQIFTDGRVTTVAGGKLTTYRRMAAETVDAAVDKLGIRCTESSTERIHLPGAEGLDVDFDELADELIAMSGLDEDVAVRIANVYGVRALEIARYAVRDERLKARIDPDHQVTLAEVAHAVDTELALEVEDVLIRRTSLALVAKDQGRGAAERVADLMAERLGWSEARRQRSLDMFRHEVDRMMWFRREEREEPARSAG